MLESIQTKVSQFGNVFPWCKNSKNATGFFWLVRTGFKIIRCVSTQFGAIIQREAMVGNHATALLLMRVLTQWNS
jgi:hypothetical protein